MSQKSEIVWFNDISMDDLSLVGGKNANLGELTTSMSRSGVPVPPGFAITTKLYDDFIEINQLAEPIATLLLQFDRGENNLSQTGSAIRHLILQAEFSLHQKQLMTEYYNQLCQRLGLEQVDVAVRSSATAEDLPGASFAGQQESYLNIRGPEALILACHKCFASLYTDRAIAYRQEQGFDDQKIALSVGVQQMVRSDLACAGVIFTLDTESGCPSIVLVTGSWGLGETVVKGSVNPDRFMVFKPLLDNGEYLPIIERSCGSKLIKMIYSDKTSTASAVDDIDSSGVTVEIETEPSERYQLILNESEVLQLARWAVVIEGHYGCAMDIEWAKDGLTGELFIVQARAETVESQKDAAVLHSYKLKEKSTVLVEGASVGSAIASGKACYLANPSESESFPEGAILVTERTDPDWVPVMRKAAGIITDTGGPTSHAAIVSRELKVPAIVGTANGSSILKTGMDITMDCASSSIAKVYTGQLDYSVNQVQFDSIPHTKTDLMINAAMPDGALRWWPLPVAGIGLARVEFIISSQIRIHPMALLHPEKISDKKVLARIEELTQGFDDKAQYFIDKLALDIGKIAASRFPKPVIVRFSDFKSNEYRGLVGGEFFELTEENPMLGLRGASRYYHPSYREAFKLECLAIKKVREVMGLSNVITMIPFCRTPTEADAVLAVMAEAGLQRGSNGLQVYVMCEVPSNVILAEQFAQRFDGFSIGSNDLTQLVLGVDRDSSELSYLFDARDEAVKKMIAHVITVAHQQGCKVGICGQAPSDHPDFAEFLVECGIDSISLNPDSITQAAEHVSNAEQRLQR